MEEARGKLPHLCAVVQYTEEPVSPGVLTWSQLLDIGRSVPDSLLQVRNLQYPLLQVSPGVLTWSQLLDIGHSVPDSLLQVRNLQYPLL